MSRSPTSKDLAKTRKEVNNKVVETDSNEEVDVNGCDHINEVPKVQHFGAMKGKEGRRLGDGAPKLQQLLPRPSDELSSPTNPIE